MEELLNLTPIQAVVMTGAVVAAVEVVKQVVDIFANKKQKEPGAWRTVAIIIVAGLVGGCISISYTGLNFIEGMVYGLSASGVLNVLQNIGKNTGSGAKED